MTTPITSLPKPKGNFLTGNLKQFKSNSNHLVLENWVKECGEIFHISFVGKKFLVSADPEFNQFVLKSRPDLFRRFHKIGEVMEELGVVGVFNAEGDEWKKHRKITSEALNTKNVRAYFPVIQSITENLVQKALQFQTQNESWNVQHEMMKYTVDITTEIAFGYPMNTLLENANVIQNDLGQIFPALQRRITAPIPIWRYIKSKEDKSLEAALKRIETFIYQFIKEAKDRLQNSPTLKENPTNFLEAMLVEQEKSEAFTDKEIYGNVFTMLLAGEDTTSNSISWIVYFLLTHPEWTEKVKNEALHVFPDNITPTSVDQLQSLKITEAVCLEAMRLKPVTPTLYMESLTDTTYKNIQLPKGTSMMLQNKVAQTDSKNFDDPDLFNPSRWIKNECPYHQHSPALMRAFGSGPRFCPGKALAMNEMIMAVSSLFKNLNLQLAVCPEEVTEVFAFTMYPENLMVK